MDNPEIVELSVFLSRMGFNRSPGSIKAKIENFKSIDPCYNGRALFHGSNTDKRIWDAYAADNFRGIEEAVESARKRIADGQEFVFRNEYLDLPDDMPGEVRKYEIGVRVNQDIFRARVMDAYGSRCCLTGIKIPELLRASHIKPWSACKEHTEERLDPRNGLCLNAFHDAAFDRGLFTLDEKLRVELSPYLEKTESRETMEKWFYPYEGQKVEPISKAYEPSEDYLDYHRKNIFLDTVGKIDKVQCTHGP